ncbi:MAG: hypothetical protein ACFFG0_05525 [Candidatus Thorarchaeota archaeon]
MDKNKLKKITIGNMDKTDIIAEIVSKVVIPLMILIVILCVFLGGCKYDPVGVEIKESYATEYKKDEIYQNNDNKSNINENNSNDQSFNISGSETNY